MSEQPKEVNIRNCKVCGKVLPDWIRGFNCSMACAAKAYQNARRPKKHEDIPPTGVGDPTGIGRG